MACLRVGCQVYNQVPIGNSNIDFYIVNPRGSGKLVEVTHETKEDIYKKSVTRERKGKKHHMPNKTGIRKQRQIKSMQESGLPWTIIFGDQLQRIIEIQTRKYQK